VKLPLREPELAALTDELARWEGYVSSSLLAVEGIRACARYGDRHEREARDFLESISLLPLFVTYDQQLAAAASAAGLVVASPS
jgi:hypothetical protein